MAKSTPWSVKGIDEDTRKVAREAARASGLTIGKWIDGATLQSTGLGARMRRLAVATRRRTGFVRPGITVGRAFGTTGLAALLLVTIVLGFGDLPVPAAKSTDAAAEPGARPDPALEQAKLETPPLPEPAPEQAKPEMPLRLAATVAKTAPASLPPIPAIEPQIPTPGLLVTLDTGGQPPLRRLDRAGIAEVQRLLAALLFTPGAPDGVAGAKTVAAIQLYQQFAGIPVDGAATEVLLRDLREITRTVKADSGVTAKR